MFFSILFAMLMGNPMIPDCNTAKTPDIQAGEVCMWRGSNAHLTWKTEQHITPTRKVVVYNYLYENGNVTSYKFTSKVIPIPKLPTR